MVKEKANKNSYEKRQQALLSRNFLIYCTRLKTKVQAQQEIFEYIEIFYTRK